ncbi:MAG: hypothetical protein OXH70_17445 [Acidobacteria bacterium]|nr:hypothetical protein [Acidobacteriota bacterium]
MNVSDPAFVAAIERLIDLHPDAAWGQDEPVIERRPIVDVVPGSPVFARPLGVRQVGPGEWVIEEIVCVKESRWGRWVQVRGPVAPMSFGSPRECLAAVDFSPGVV